MLARPASQSVPHSMSAPSPDPTEPRCPGCGAGLAGFSDETCTGARCPSCGFAVVTTNPNRPSFDPTRYDVWIHGGTKDRPAIIVSLANALCIGVVNARAILDTGAPIAQSVSAVEVERLARILHDHGLALRITPPFPWPLD